MKTRFISASSTNNPVTTTAQAVAMLRDRGERFDCAVIASELLETDASRWARVMAKDAGGASLAIVALSSSEREPSSLYAGLVTASLAVPLRPSRLFEVLVSVLVTRAGAGITSRGPVTAALPSSVRILLAEDNSNNQRVARLSLEKLGLRADIVADGSEVLQALKHIDYDVILMDLQMPVMNGIEATKRIRQMADARKRATPIIAITANAMPGEDQPCFDAGMNAYVTKPIDRASMLSAIDQLLS